MSLIDYCRLPFRKQLARPDALTGGGVPHLQGAIAPPRQQLLAIRAPCTRIDRADMAGEGEQARSSPGVPHLQGVVVSA